MMSQATTFARATMIILAIAAVPGSAFAASCKDHPPDSVYNNAWRFLHGCNDQPIVAPPAPPTKPFLVFFDFGKSELDQKSAEVIAEAVHVAKLNGFKAITITGHTDTAEPDSQALSLARATAAKAEMVREGLSPDTISVVGKGSEDLLVPNAPGVREPQNRRIVIDLG